LRFAKPFSIQFEVTLLAVKLFKSAVEELSLTISRIFAWTLHLLAFLDLSRAERRCKAGA